jgi:hypothetical protein
MARAVMAVKLQDVKGRLERKERTTLVRCWWLTP